MICSGLVVVFVFVCPHMHIGYMFTNIYIQMYICTHICVSTSIGTSGHVSRPLGHGTYPEFGVARNFQDNPGIYHLNTLGKNPHSANKVHGP